MMTADFVSGRLAWNSRAIPTAEVKQMKGSGTKLKADMSGLKKMSDTKAIDLDNLIATMDAKDVIPPIGSGLVSKKKGRKLRAEGILDSVAAKYGIGSKQKRNTRRRL